MSGATELLRDLDQDHLLAVYAVARARDPLPDPLATPGLPLIDHIVRHLHAAPVRVTAARAGEDGGFVHWSLVIAFASGLAATVDIGAGFGPAQAADLDWRVEWSGSGTVILEEPSAVAVTVLGRSGAREHSAEVEPLADALLGGAVAPASDIATRIVAAARESAAMGRPVALGS